MGLIDTFRHRAGLFFGNLVEHDQGQGGHHAILREQTHGHFDPQPGVTPLNANRLGLDGLAAGARLVDGRAQFVAQLRLRIVQKVDRWRAAAGLQELADAFRQMQDVVVAVDQYAGQNDLVDQLAMQFCKRSRPGGAPVGSALVENQPFARKIRFQQQMPHGAAGRIGFVKPAFFVHQGKKLGCRISRLRSAEKQIPFGFERKPKGCQNARLSGLVQVNQQIAAADQIDSGKRRIAQHIVAGEQHFFAHLLGHPKTVFFKGEEMLQPDSRHIRRNGRRIQAVAGEGNRPVVNIGCKHLKLRPAALQLHLFFKQQGDGIGLLAGGAAHHPDPHRIGRRAVVQQLGQHLLLQRLKSLGIAKKIGDTDQHVLHQRLGFFRIRPQKGQISGQVRHAVDLHSALDAPQHRGPLVLAKIVFGMGAQQRHDLAQRFLVKPVGGVDFGLWRLNWYVGILGQTDAAGIGPQVNQPLRHVGRLEHKIHHAGGNGRTGHAVVFGIFRGLRHRQPALPLDPGQARSAVCAGARQDNGDGALLVSLGQRAEKQVDRQMRAPGPDGIGQHQLSVVH